MCGSIFFGCVLRYSPSGYRQMDLSGPGIDVKLKERKERKKDIIGRKI
jgi:hypothetical protein